MLLPALTLFSGVSFLGFGTACLRSQPMRREFARYGLERFRVLTGLLQLAGGAGLLVGWWAWPPLACAAATGLASLMLLGVFTRLRIRDSLLQTAPATLYMALNAYLAVRFGVG